MKKVRNIKYNLYNIIDCEINHPVYGWIPISLSDKDNNIDNINLLNDIRNNKYGKINEYIPDNNIVLNIYNNHINQINYYIEMLFKQYNIDLLKLTYFDIKLIINKLIKETNKTEINILNELNEKIYNLSIIEMINMKISSNSTFDVLLNKYIDFISYNNIKCIFDIYKNYILNDIVNNNKLSNIKKIEMIESYNYKEYFNIKLNEFKYKYENFQI